MRLYDSLYETALKQNIPKPIIDDLVRIFANDVDFQRPVTGGDSFEAFYDNGEEGEQRNELLYASIIARNETYRYYRFQTPDDGLVDFYDQNGKSSRKFLIRTPIVGARDTSPFGMRFHPILGYTRMHTRRRLGGADRHADLRRRQWRHRIGGLGLGLRPARRHPARQWLYDDL